jgi:integrase
MKKRKSNRGKYGLGRVYQPKYKDADGVERTVNKFYIQFYDKHGNQHRGPAKWPNGDPAKSETEARKILAVALGKVQQGQAPAPDEKSLRYGDIRADLLHDYRVRKLKSLETLSDGTETIKGLTKLDEFFAYKSNGDEDKGLKVGAFNNKAWEQDFIMARRKEGVSDATIVNSAKLLSAMLNLAHENGRISTPIRITVPPSPKARKEYLSGEQFHALLDEMAVRFHPLLKFLFYQGVRIQETLHIEWPQFNLSAGVFHPNAAENKTKNDEPKSLHSDVVKALRPLQRADGLVFDGLSQKMFEKAFRKAMLKLGYGKPMWQCSQCRSTKDAPAPKHGDPAIPCAKCKVIPMQYHYVGPTPHSLRASGVVFYRESGMSDPEIMAITGHSTNKAFLGYSRTRLASIKQKMDAAKKNRDLSLWRNLPCLYPFFAE